ncbi:hypothetical protein [Micromonospora sp. WMMD737]|uniref:hypothetical protein n=1 Tax=Micromonospora sp. WMMD737 TaxID=3404113 RepID=UPI003B944669
MILPEGRLGVLVSLPHNDVTLAAAARDAAADGLKVHMNIHHRASGTRFGDLDEEGERLREIVSLGLATGLVVGAARTVDPAQTRRAAQLGFDYFDVYAAYANTTYVTDCGPATAMAAIGPNDDVATAAALVAQGIGAIEVSTVDPADYGTPLSLGTLARLTALRAAVDVPLIVPTQHRLVPADLAALAAAGADAVLLGAVVTGTTAPAITAAVAQFRTAAHSASPHGRRHSTVR